MLSPATKSRRVQAVSLTLAFLVSLPVRAGVIPGRWEKVAAIAEETPIIVDLKNGDRIEGPFGELSPSELLLNYGSARAAIPKADVERITIRQKDSLANGSLIGAGTAAGIAGLVFGAQPPASDPILPLALLYTGVVAAIGAGLGALVDASEKRVVVLYEAPETSQ